MKRSILDMPLRAIVNPASLLFVAFCAFAVWFTTMANVPNLGKIAATSEYWDYMCRHATRVEAQQVIDGPTGPYHLNGTRNGQKAYHPMQQLIVLSKEWGYTGIDVKGNVLCDDGTELSTVDGHKL